MATRHMTGCVCIPPTQQTFPTTTTFLSPTHPRTQWNQYSSPPTHTLHPHPHTVESVQLLRGALEQCNLHTSIAPPPTTTPLGPCMHLLQSHGDQVLDIPMGAVLLGSSPTAQHEAWWLDGRVLALQGHPELDTQSALERILPALVNNGYGLVGFVCVCVCAGGGGRVVLFGGGALLVWWQW